MSGIRIIIGTGLLVLIGLLIYNADQIIKQSKHKQAMQYEVFNTLSTKGRIDSIEDSIINWLTDKILGKEKKSRQDKSLNKLVVSIKRIQNRINKINIDFIVIAAVALVLAFWLRQSPNDLAIVMLLISAICLWVGLASPILTIESSENLPVVGKTVFQYESKSILGSIHKLNLNDNKFLALVLLLFSIILPFAKTLTLLIINLVKNFKHQQKLSAFFSHLGKWSMTDVFVVAILVVFFATGNNSTTKSATESGLYYFAAYVMLSLIASIVLSRESKKKTH